MPVDLTLEIRAGTSWADSVLSAVQSFYSAPPSRTDTFLLNLLLMSAINGTLVFFQLGLWFYNNRVFIYFACLWTSMYAK